jgi:hypothetical protein
MTIQGRGTSSWTAGSHLEHQLQRLAKQVVKPSESLCRQNQAVKSGQTDKHLPFPCASLHSKDASWWFIVRFCFSQLFRVDVVKDLDASLSELNPAVTLKPFGPLRRLRMGASAAPASERAFCLRTARWWSMGPWPGEFSKSKAPAAS